MSLFNHASIPIFIMNLGSHASIFRFSHASAAMFMINLCLTPASFAVFRMSVHSVMHQWRCSWIFVSLVYHWLFLLFVMSVFTQSCINGSTHSKPLFQACINGGHHNGSDCVCPLPYTGEICERYFRGGCHSFGNLVDFFLTFDHFGGNVRRPIPQPALFFFFSSEDQLAHTSSTF